MCKLSIVVMSGDYSLIGVNRLLILVTSLVVKHGMNLGRAGSVTVAHGLSCPLTCGIFLDEGLNLCLLNWQVYS